MQKAKYRYYNCGGKENAAEYYIANKEVLRENAKDKYKNLSEGEKEVNRGYGIHRYRNMTEDKKKQAK